MFLKLSPNEVENIVQEERGKWRKFRVLQVRAQAKEQASKIRHLRKKEEAIQKKNLQQTLKENWAKDHEEKLKKLIEEYENCMKDFGEAHKRAEKERKTALLLAEKRIENSKVAQQRGVLALKNMHKAKLEQRRKENLPAKQREKMKKQERQRAQRLAQLPTPEKLKIQRKPMETAVPRKVMLHEAGTFTTSSYVPSSETVQKESSSGLSANEAAIRKIEEEREMECTRALKMKEEQLKILERGKAAEKRERLKEMRRILMEGLERAEEEHELSDYLKGDDSHVDVESSSTSGLLEDSTRERRAEKKVELLISENLIKTQSNAEVRDTERIWPPSDDSADPEEQNVNLRLSIREDVGTIGELQVGKESDITNRYSTDIHMKSTIPIDKLPIVLDKFKKSEKHHFEDSGTSTTTTTEEEISNIIVDGIDDISSTDSKYKELTNKLRDRLKMYEELKSKSIVNSPSNIYDEVSMPGSYSTDYLDLPQSLQSKNQRKNFQKLIAGQIPEKDAEFDQEKPNPVERSKETHLVRETHLMKPLNTPSKTYSKELKREGSGKRPKSRKEKFDHCKKAVVELYVKKLLELKREEIKQLSASSVEGSGFDFTSDLCELFKSKLSPSSKGNSSSSPVTGSLDDDVDTIPVKLSSVSESLTSSGSTMGYQRRESSEPSSSRSSSSSSSLADERFQQEVLKRLYQVEQLRMMVLSRMVPRLSSATNHFTRSSGTYPKRDDTTLEYSYPSSYETPSREDSTFSPQYGESRRQYYKSGTLSHQSAIITKIREEALQDLNVEMQSLKDKVPSLSTDSSDYSLPPSSIINLDDGSPVSMPDMVSVLERFGLSWATTMNRKMDEAEENCSSDSSHQKGK